MSRLSVSSLTLLVSLASASAIADQAWPVAPNEKGCCQANTLYTGIGSNARQTPCDRGPGTGATPFCGWDAGSHRYDCNTQGGGDPSGQYPYSCQFPTGCVADCAGKSCGPDGCGGTCGSCLEGDVCGVDQACHPSDCGDVTDVGCCVPTGFQRCIDGRLYAVTCDSCGWDVASSKYRCFTPGTPDPSGAHPFLCTSVGTCVPDCTGRVCGGNGCGESCGTCPAADECRYGICTVRGPDAYAASDLPSDSPDLVAGAPETQPGPDSPDGVAATPEAQPGSAGGCTSGNGLPSALPGLLLLLAAATRIARRARSVR